MEEIELEIRQTKKASDQLRLFFPNKDFANREIDIPSIKDFANRVIDIPSIIIIANVGNGSGSKGNAFRQTKLVVRLQEEDQAR